MTQALFRSTLRRFAMEFSTQRELEMYLEEHPNADRSKHRVMEGPDKRDRKTKSRIEDKIIELHEYSDLDPEYTKMRHVDHAIKVLEDLNNMSREDLKQWSKGDVTAIAMARDWFKKGLKNPNVDEAIKKRVRGKLMPALDKFFQRAKNVSRGK